MRNHRARAGGTAFAIVSFMWVVMNIMGCGRAGQNEPADPISAYGRPTDTDAKPSAPSATMQLSLIEPTVLRSTVSAVLEKRVTVPAGTMLRLPVQYEIQILKYRKDDGTIDWSSTGFISPVEIASAPSSSGLTAAKIKEYNQTAGGLFISADIVGDIQGVSGSFPVIAQSTPGDGFLKDYEPSGQPKFNFTKGLVRRWGAHVNQGVDPASLPAAQREKWQRIYQELRAAADRTVPTSRSILMIDPGLAQQESIAIEQSGVIPRNGAWTIATQATAVRHGFANTPCAEFMSEMIREAYVRAGYQVTDDFNEAKKNRLLWSDSAAVVAFSEALNTAGWVPWDTSIYRPMTGAILMNGNGMTPGHTYIAGGDDGRLIVDNGAPQGRDLRLTKQKTIEIMYQTGVFFLPPGINPQKW